MKRGIEKLLRGEEEGGQIACGLREKTGRLHRAMKGAHLSIEWILSSGVASVSAPGGSKKEQWCTAAVHLEGLKRLIEVNTYVRRGAAVRSCTEASLNREKS